MNIFQRVRELSLPLDQYVVFGSGPLAAHGIRPTQDVDLFVTTTLYEQLKLAGWDEKELAEPPGGLGLVHGIYEANDSWHYSEYDPTPEEVIAACDIIYGVPFAPLAEVLKWKRAFGRPKDLVDIELIEQHLKALL